MRLPKVEQWAPVEVHWQDSAGGESGWHKPKKHELEIDGCVTIGQVYAIRADRICLVLSRDTSNKNIDSIITIPTIAITAFHALRRIATRA